MSQERGGQRPRSSGDSSDEEQCCQCFRIPRRLNDFLHVVEMNEEPGGQRQRSSGDSSDEELETRDLRVSESFFKDLPIEEASLGRSPTDSSRFRTSVSSSENLETPGSWERNSEQELQGKRDSEKQSEMSSSLPSSDQKLDLEECHGMFQGPNEPIKVELIDKKRNIYRAHFPNAGFYHWPDTGLGFSVRSDVTIDIEFDSWNQHLDCTQKQDWMIAGPLFNIRVIAGVVTSVHLPHFIDIQGGRCDTSLFRIAHFKEEGMVLENPTRVESSHVILENSGFSPIGVLLTHIYNYTFRFIPIHSATLIYYKISDGKIVLHLYLIPNDCTIRKAIDEEKACFKFSRLPKPSPIARLYTGSHFFVSGSEHLEILPGELEFQYRSMGEYQIYSEIYISNVEERIILHLKDENKAEIWTTVLRSSDFGLVPALGSSASLGTDFIKKHYDVLIERVTSVDAIADKLYNSELLSKEQYDMVRAESTNQNKMRTLLSFHSSWNYECEKKFIQCLKEIHPYLVKDLLEGQNTARVQRGF